MQTQESEYGGTPSVSAAIPPLPQMEAWKKTAEQRQKKLPPVVSWVFFIVGLLLVVLVIFAGIFVSRLGVVRPTNGAPARVGIEAHGTQGRA